MSDKTWKFGYKLSWELFSEAVYSYRQTINEIQKHKLHMHCKNGIFAAITSLEAFMNESLISEHKWGKTKLDNKKNNYPVKLNILIQNFSNEEPYYQKFNNYKKIRNNYLVHHKENDFTYVNKINPNSLLETIESVQEIIARICFNNKNIGYPYWLSGLNFINPKHNHDIDLLNGYEFWTHLIHYRCFDIDSLSIKKTHATIEYPTQWDEYKKNYQYIWNLLKKYKFDIDIESPSIQFPYMPYLSCKYWSN